MVEILKGPQQALITPTKPFIFGEHDPKHLANLLIDTMIAAPGIGLSANQIDIPLRAMAFIDSSNPDFPTPKVMFNPEILETSIQRVKFEEGCLSFPGLYATIDRPEVINLRFQDIFGDTHTAWVGGLNSRIIQHEVEHLDGKLFYNNLSFIKRQILLRKWRKSSK